MDASIVCEDNGAHRDLNTPTCMRRERHHFAADERSGFSAP
jgi:hypothetical protein